VTEATQSRPLLVAAIFTAQSDRDSWARAADAYYAKLPCRTPFGDGMTRCFACEACARYSHAIQQEVAAQLALNAAERAFAAWQPRQERLDFGR
jgi:hypothetical protein